MRLNCQSSRACLAWGVLATSTHVTTVASNCRPQLPHSNDPRLCDDVGSLTLSSMGPIIPPFRETCFENYSEIVVQCGPDKDIETKGATDAYTGYFDFNHGAALGSREPVPHLRTVDHCFSVAPRCAGRLETGAPQDPLRDVGNGPGPHGEVPQERSRGGRGAGKVPSTRGPSGL